MKSILILMCILLTVPAFARPRHPPRPVTVPKPAYRVIKHIPAKTIIPPIQHDHSAKRDQTLCLALAMYYEARGTQSDRVPVAQVIFNRKSQTGQSVCAIVWAKHGTQFPWVHYRNLTPHETEAWQSIQWNAVDFMSHRPFDQTFGATYFYNPKLCRPEWADAGVVTARLNHVYMKIDPKH